MFRGLAAPFLCLDAGVQCGLYLHLIQRQLALYRLRRILNNSRHVHFC